MHPSPRPILALQLKGEVAPLSSSALPWLPVAMTVASPYRVRPGTHGLGLMQSLGPSHMPSCMFKCLEQWF